MYGRFKKIIISGNKHMDLPLGPICFFVTKYLEIHSRQTGGGGVSEMFFGEEGYGRINGGTRVLELAADSWEAMLGHDGR
jgi:hypothetical protein